MESRRQRSLRLIWLAMLAAIVCGCGKTSRTTSARLDTGADKTARTFFDGLLKQDWASAYGVLDAESKAWCSETDFASRGADMLSHLGFTPGEVRVAVSEKDDHASAIAVFRSTPGSTKQFKDGADLRRTAEGWRVVLRKNFGVSSPLIPPAAK